MKQFIIALFIITAILAAAFSISFYIEVNFKTLDTLASEMFDLAQAQQLDRALEKSEQFEQEYERISGVLDYTANTMDQTKLEVAYRKLVTYLRGQLADGAAALEELHSALTAMRESEKFSLITIF